MCRQLLRCLLALWLLLARLDAALATEATDLPDSSQDRADKLANQKGRLSLQNTADIQHCLVTTGDVGCGVFECFENNSCEIRGLHEICMTFLHNAGRFDAQGKSFIKDALKCKAHGLRHKFSCISRKCPAIKEMVYQLQKECYAKHDLCSAAKDNVQVIVEMIHFKDLLLHEPYVDLVNILLTCGDEVKDAITRSVQTQCAQNWGSLCTILSFCTTAMQGDGMPDSSVPSAKKQGDSVKGDTGKVIRSDSSQSDLERDMKSSKFEKTNKGQTSIRGRPVSNNKIASSATEGSEKLLGSTDIRR
ncbi:stanniocalcin-2 [Gastrophryne carolinensis]